MMWLFNALALTVERLYRLRYLHRGSYLRLSAVQLCRLLWLNLARSVSLPDSNWYFLLACPGGPVLLVRVFRLFSGYNGTMTSAKDCNALPARTNGASQT
jgi:hypothetical protein